MGQPGLKITLTADLHWGIARGMNANHAMVDHVLANPPDVFLLAGDIGHSHHFAECLGKFQQLDCIKALVPGNHDIWVTQEDQRGTSWDLYSSILPKIASEFGFHYLDQNPLHLDKHGLSIVGNMNWYDYSWSEQKILENYPGEEARLLSKRFTRGQHNDFNYVRWQHDDKSFTREIVGVFGRHLEQVRDKGNRSLVITHHPAIRPLGFPQLDQDTSLDALLWEGLSGNASLENLILGNKHFVSHVFCGHTHRVRMEDWNGIRGYNIGSDYHFKRLLEMSWPDGEITAREFHGW